MRMVSQGASLLNISLVVAAADLRPRGRIAAPGIFRVEARDLTKLAIVGYGKMGRLIEQLAPEYGFTIHARIDVERRSSAAPRAPMSRSSSPLPDAVAGECREALAALGIPVVVGTTGWLSEMDRVRAAVEQHGTGAGLESQFFHRRERVLRGWCARPPGCWRTSRSTARGPGRFIITPRKTRLPGRC